MSDLVPRSTLTQICARRRTAIDLFAQAHGALQTASTALLAAHKAVRMAAPPRNSYSRSTEEEKEAFLAGMKVPARDDFLNLARRMVDIDVWAHLVDMTDLERLMDKEEKDKLRRQLLEDPPEVNEENVIATMETLALNADMIFRRGIANTFSKLDRRFKSHDGWKIGNRVILSRAFDDGGYWNYHQNHRDTLRDIERTFFVLEGKPVPLEYAGIVGAIDMQRSKGYGRHQAMVESDYFRLRTFMNGNAHLWFKRDDLVDKVNRRLGEYYGAPIPEDREAEDDGGLNTPKTSLAKNYGFFPTPPELAARVIYMSKLGRAKDCKDPVLTVLEPSAGTGALAAAAANGGAMVDCIEIQPTLTDQLRNSGCYRRVTNANFLVCQPNPTALYDRVIMNPPFDRERDIDHIMHALKFLKPDGFLVAIMSAGTEFRETRKSIAFRELMTRMNAQWQDLPAGSFSSVGTNCNTIMLHVYRDGRRFYL